MRQRILLGAMLASAGMPVEAERLAEIVWDGVPPERAVPTLRTYVARLRSDLGPEGASRIVTGDGGYLARVSPGELDVLAFDALHGETGSAIRTGDWVAAADHAAQAIALWRGNPLSDAPSQALRDMWLPRLEQQRIQVIDWHIDAELHLGRHEELVAQLRQLVADHPLHERFHAQLMRALARCGRQVEALAAYQDARKVLVAELGIGPGPELRKLHENILADDGDAATPRATVDLVSTCASPAESAGAVVPRQLPAAPGHFTGRRGELHLITGLPVASRQEEDARGGTVVIAAIDGMAGIGKTALAVRAAHRLGGEFPDGQLFIDLHGHTQGYPPREPVEALGSLLRSLGVPAGQVPAAPEECAALYRQRLAGTRTLIVLDNALDEAQVRPLLPGAPGCLVLVTSRRRLKSLHDAHVVALDVLPEADAITLLRKVIAPAHAAVTDPDLAEIAGQCGRLPLALRIAGAMLRHRPAWTPRYLAELLRDEHGCLATLTDGDRDLRAVFDLSYAGLGQRQRLLFRQLALVPGPDLDKFAAAALLDADPAVAARLLEDLVDHNLLIEHAPGRYRLHDLIRVHARTLADEDPQADRDHAVDRLLRYYTHNAQRASALAAHWPRPDPDCPVPACAPALTDPETARAWLRAERENLQAAHGHARRLALDEHTIALAAGLAEILRSDGPLASALELHQAAADTAERCGWHVAQATALTDLATVRRLTGDLAGAGCAATRALGICLATRHRHGEATALAELGHVRLLDGDLAGAGEAYTRSLEIFRATGHRHGEAAALISLGSVRLQTGDLPGATDAAGQALEICRATGHRHGEANSLTDLGRLRGLAGDLSRAEDALSRAVEIFRATGHRHGEATALAGLGHVRLLDGDIPGAAEAATRALGICLATGHRNGEAIALAELGHVRHAAGDLSGAEDALSRALEIFRATGHRHGEAWALNYYAAVTAAGDLPRALALYQQALAINRKLNKPDDEAIALEGLGECSLTTGQRGTGITYLSHALRIYQRLGMKTDIERVSTRLAQLTAMETRTDLRQRVRSVHSR